MADERLALAKESVEVLSKVDWGSRTTLHFVLKPEAEPIFSVAAGFGNHLWNIF